MHYFHKLYFYSMAFGFTPKYSVDIPINDISSEHFIALVISTMEKLEWPTISISQTRVIAHTAKSMWSANYEVSVSIDNGIATVKSESLGREMVDWNRNKKRVETFLAAMEEERAVISNEDLKQKYESISLGVTADETSDNSEGNFWSAFIPRKSFFVTPLLMDLNILVFICMACTGVNILQPDNESLLKWGANFGPYTLNGQWWRLLTATFVHGGIFHLLMNMYALLYIGILLEPKLGKTRFATSYLLTGIVASVTSLAWHSYTVSVGASGAIFGMYGVFLAMLTTNHIDKSVRKQLLASILVFVGYNLLNGLKAGIDNAAHIGGLLSGLIIGYAMMPSLSKPDAISFKYATAAILCLLIVPGVFIFCRNIPNDIGTYDAKMKSFFEMEGKALEFYHKDIPNTPKKDLLYAINEHGIYYWNKNIQLLGSLEKLDVPEVLHEQDKKLLIYCDLRIKSYNMLDKIFSTEDSLAKKTYHDSLDFYSMQINDILNSLNPKNQ